jgi:two-component system chemotaxis sensor kinase CheA
MDELTREFLIESQEALDRMERCLTELEGRPNDAGLLADIFRSVHTIKGTTGFLGFKRLEKLAHAGENLLGMLRDGALPAGPDVITGLLQLLDSFRSILKTIEAEDGEGSGEDAPLIERLRELQQPDTTVDRAFSGPPENSRETLAPASPLVHETQARAVPAAPAERTQSANDRGTKPPLTGSSAVETTLRVDVALLNRIMNLVGELVLTRNQVLQATSTDAGMTLLSRRLDMVTADLREAVMKARLQPISHIFSKMPRIIRDLSQALERRVRLEVEGQDTELDKSLLEAIKDPLTHAVRNALDHGIEPPAVREAAGKSAEGVLRLRAAQEGSHVLIDISDDGAGIDVAKIRQKAIDRGLVKAERAAQLNDRELLQFIFVPGFSTAAAVTNVSGRGVGMDVVRTNVERIGGKVEIDSHTGKGTTLRLRIPLTLAIIPALIVRSLGQSFALPQGALSELVHIPPEQAATAIEWIENAPLYRLRGKLLPLIFLNRLLRPGAATSCRPGDHFIAVLDADGRRYGLVVDGLADPEEIVVKPLSTALKAIGLYSGATVLGSGSLALILDPGAIALRCRVALANESEASRASEEDEESISSARMEFLLVDIAGRQAAIPLQDVLRIEQLPATRLEYIGYRPVLNFDGQVLPVEDQGDVLAAAQQDNSQIIIVVCRENRRHVGIAVSHVLDVSAGDDLVQAGTGQRTEGVTLLKSRLTNVLDLGSIASLANSASPADSWSELAGRAG